MINLYRENIVTLEEVRATLHLGGDAETIDKLNKYQDVKDASVLNQNAEAKEEMVKEEAPEEKDEKNDSVEKDTSDKKAS